MTPVYLNPSTSSFPLLELKEEQTLQLFISPSSSHHQATTSSIPCAAFSNNRSTVTQDQVHDGSAFGASEIVLPEKDISFCGGTIDRHVFPSSSTHQSIHHVGGEFESHKLSINDLGINGDRHHYHQSENVDYGIKWMSSKMRFMHKMKSTPNCTGSNDHKAIKVVHKFADHHDDNHSARFNFTGNNNTGNIRVCADCNTTTTPLWRSGPRGPKSLCNACGIRQRKARRAMEEAAAAAASGVPVGSEGSAGTTRTNKVHNKDRKPRSGTHVGHYKKHGKAMFDINNHHVHGEKKMLFKNLDTGLGENSGFRQVFSQDVAEAAILLMELSCGLVHG